MRILSFSGLVLLAILTMGNAALACDCLTLTPQQSFEQADVVFEGELIRSGPIAGRNAFTGDTFYTFEVSYTLKGPPARELTLVGGHTDCDYFFFPNTVYRIHARRSGSELFTGSCSANQVLRTSKIHAPPAEMQSWFVWSSWYTKTVVIGGICLLTLFVVWLLARGIRPQQT